MKLIVGLLACLCVSACVASGERCRGRGETLNAAPETKMLPESRS